MSVETQDRTFIGNYKIVISFNAPIIKTLPVDSYLLDVTISDPCDSDIWTNSDFGVLTYMIGDSTLSKTFDITNTLSVSFCEFTVVSVQDDWSNNLVASSVVSAENTNTTLTLYTQTYNNSKRVQTLTLNV